MRLGIDIDDVLYEWAPAVHRLCESAGITNGAPPKSWAPYEEYGCTREEWLAAVSEATVSGELYMAEPIKGVCSSLRKLRFAGHSLHLITARGWLPHGPVIKQHTAAWLDRWQVPYDSLTFSGNKTILDADVFVDDQPDNFIALRRAGMRCYLVDQPWNQEINTSYRVADFNQFANTILELDGYVQRWALGIGQYITGTEQNA